MGRGLGVEEKEVVGVEDGEGEAGSREEARVLPMMPVRVLLAEGDDSTRHIISALLRKCGYHVAAAADGVKAWEILKEKSFKIDLVLTEVELPSMSGFLLLSTIMEHDACKNIPVIMMSSNDAVSMVFKCMLKGAADFLVKPIRKNELRNLWQHVWRKQLANLSYPISQANGGLHMQHTQQEENQTERDEQKTGMSKAEYLIENVAQKIRECSEQESDAQSSCTRSDPEAESKHTNNFLEFKQLTGMQSSDHNKSTEENGETKAQNDNLIPRREGELLPRRWACPNDSNCDRASGDIEVVHIIDEEQKHNTQREADIMRTTSQGNCEIGSGNIEVVHIIDEEQKHNIQREVDIMRTTSQGNCDKWFSIPAHQLELSLKRSDYSKLENQEKNERRTLNHSTSSAFSLYNCRTTSSYGNAGDSQVCSTSAPYADLENENRDSAAPSKEKAGPSCPPIRAVPFPVTAGGLTFNGQPFWSSAPVAPLVYPQLASPIWNSKTSMSREAAKQATSLQQKSQQDDPTDMDSQQTEKTEEQEVLTRPNANEKYLHVEIPSDTSRHISPMTGESRGSNVLDISRNALSGSGCASSSKRITTPSESSNAFNGATENPSIEGSHQLSQREAALNKFRLKRKERCFEKKVRYQSRKLLAEQRPRVKGQFVRQDHSIQGS